MNRFSSVTQLCPTLCDPIDFSRPGFPVHHYCSLLRPMSIESVMPSNHLILCRPLLLLPSVFPSIKVFSNESALRIRSFNFNISPSSEYSGLISFRMDWLDLLAGAKFHTIESMEMELASFIQVLSNWTRRR